MATIQAVIFDIDDTLYPEVAFTRSGYRAVADAFRDRLNAPFDLFERMVELFNSPERARVFNVIAEEAGAGAGAGGPAGDGGLVDDMVACFRGHTPRIALFPDADAALTALAKSYRLGAISDGYLHVQQAKAEALGLHDRLEAVILTDAWGRGYWKPHPRAYEEIASRLDVPPAACMYVGDNPAKDFVAPNALGWRTVCVDRPTGVHRSNPAPSAGAAQVTIPSLAQLPAMLDNAPFSG